MSFIRDLAHETTSAEMLGAASRTANANGTGIDLTGYDGVYNVIIDCGAATAGTNPTADFKIQDSADNSAWADASPAINAAQVTTVASVQNIGVEVRTVRRYIRVVFTIGGTASPAFPIAVVGNGSKAIQ